MAVFGTNEELVSKIGEGLFKCKKSKLSLEEYETLLNQVRELHERIILIRHKAFEALSHPETTSKEAEKQEDESIAFSLFDDAPKEETIEVKQEKIDSPQPKKEELIQDDEQKTVEISNDPFEVKNEKNSLADSFSTDDKDLAASMQESPISSIKEAFSLNDRIRLIKNLFNQNADEFNTTVKALDEMSDKDEVLTRLSNLEQDLGWDKEHEDYVLLINLIHRKFQ